MLLRSSNTAHVSHTASYVSPFVVIIGGYSISTGQPVTSNTVEVYDPVAASVVFPSLSFGYVAPTTVVRAPTTNFLPATRSEHSAAVWDNAIFIYGGQNTAIMGDMWRYIIISPLVRMKTSSSTSLCLASGGGSSGVWDQVTAAVASSFPIARKGHATAVYATNASAMTALVFGGTLVNSYQDVNDAYFVTIKKTAGTTACQNAQPKVTWQRVVTAANNTAPSPRAYMSVTLNPPGGTFPSCMVVYGGIATATNIVNGELWTLCPKMAGPSLIPVEQQVYVWTLLAPVGTAPNPRYGHTAAPTYADRFLVVGGSFMFPNDYMGDAWEYNMVLQRWIQQSLLVTGTTAIPPRRFHSMTTTPQGVLVILGGIGRYALLDATSTQCPFASAQCAAGSIQMFCNATGQARALHPIHCHSTNAVDHVPAMCGRIFRRRGRRAMRFLSPGPGTYSLVGSSSCTSCPVGTYSSITAAPSLQSCTPCPAGTFSQATGASSFATCLSCSAGTFSSAPGAPSCAPCAAGSYSGSNASVCALCPIGTFSQSQASTCSNCSAGSFAPFTAMGACLACPLGMYSNATASKCTGCPLGTANNALSGAFTNCVACTAGTYADTLGLTTCKVCPDGTASSVARSSSVLNCSICPLGTYASGLVGKTACVGCPNGTFANRSGTAVCLTCPSNSFTSGSSATSATACRLCASGTQFNATTGQCTACPAGSYATNATTAGSPGCALCPYGAYTTSLTDAQNTQCLSCSAMQVSATMGATSCQSCAPGSYSSNQWSTCLPCSSPCPVGRNGGLCSNQGTCVYGGCVCNATYAGYACQTPLSTTTTAGVVFFATPNQTVLFDNVTTNVVTLQREGGANGTLRVVVSVAPPAPTTNNATTTSGGLPAAWSTTVTFATQQMTANVTLPVHAIATGSGGCASLALVLLDVAPGTVPSCVSATDAKSLLLLVQATAIATTTIQLVSSTASGYALSIAVSTTAASSTVTAALPVLVAPVNTYFYFDTNLDATIVPLVPAMIARLQGSYAAMSIAWQFLSNLNGNASTVFASDTTGLMTSLNAISTFPVASFNGAFLNTTFLPSLQWSPGALRTVVIFTTATSLASTTVVSSIKQACLQSNVVPYFVVPSTKLSVTSALVTSLGLGAAAGYTINSFVTLPWQMLQTPTPALVYIVSNPNSLVQSVVSTAAASLSITFRKATAVDPIQSTVVANVLGLGEVQLTLATFVPACASPLPQLTTWPLLNGWVAPFTTSADLASQWTLLSNASSSSSSLTALLTMAQGLAVVSTNNATVSYGQRVTVYLQPNLPIAVRAYVQLPLASNTTSSSIELIVGGRGNFVARSAVPMTLNPNVVDWQFVYATVVVPQTLTSLQIVLNTTTTMKVANLGVYPDPAFACRCDPGFYVQNGNCKRCPTGFACGGGVLTQCTGPTYTFGAFSACKPCLTGWTCSSGLATPCPKGTFTSDATTCQPCPPGYQCLQGLKSLCSAGSFATGSALECSLCLPGTFANTSGASVCFPCPAGFTSSYRRDHCIPCASGTISTQGAFPCANCPINSFATSGSPTCTSCPQGYMTFLPGSQECEKVS
ncbi:Aste57867_24936 [Aphanomyces stellatus]|uniref:Aste57867_24936 protein n=1 Tax=Aphanomyces stellatus TaxID=120398 RepID=A0A485LW02_9STRA|nr:hypothetical protein As57867_024858 [Aphanomyces stellatus]VFU01567.1 Aste57867_24936 [Aphanomyces stellatus]